MNILMIGDSTCYYWTDELWGLLCSAGYEAVNVCNLYYSGCTLEKYYNDWQVDAPAYRFITVNAEGRKLQENVSFESALKMYDWDIISFQNSKTASAKHMDREGALRETEPYLGRLFAYVHGLYPSAQYFWNENWSPEIGYRNRTYSMDSLQQRSQLLVKLRYVAAEVSRKYGFAVIPLGEAWEKVRDMALFAAPIPGIGAERFTLCSRISKGVFVDDLGHDGDIGGGQYLNACVAFEILTGSSCLGNQFRPQYAIDGIDCSLTEEKIRILQQAAHDAVSQWNV